MTFLRSIAFGTAFHTVNVGYKAVRGAQAAAAETKECGSSFAAGWRAAIEANRPPAPVAPAPVETVPAELVAPAPKRTRRSAK